MWKPPEYPGPCFDLHFDRFDGFIFEAEKPFENVCATGASPVLPKFICLSMCCGHVPFSSSFLDRAMEILRKCTELKCTKTRKNLISFDGVAEILDLVHSETFLGAL